MCLILVLTGYYWDILQPEAKFGKDVEEKKSIQQIKT
jgi:hypothetical protein